MRTLEGGETGTWLEQRISIGIDERPQQGDCRRVVYNATRIRSEGALYATGICSIGVERRAVIVENAEHVKRRSFERTQHVVFFEKV